MSKQVAQVLPLGDFSLIYFIAVQNNDKKLQMDEAKNNNMLIKDIFHVRLKLIITEHINQ